MDPASESGTHTTGVTPRTALLASNTQAVNSLAMLEKTAGNLPELPNVSEPITIISDDNNLPSETQKRVVSITKQQVSNTPAKQCPGY